MDAETRHQLKTNELAEALEKLKDFNSPWVKYPLIAAAILLVAWVGWSSWKSAQSRALATACKQFDELSAQVGDPNDPNYPAALNALTAFADSQTNPSVAGYARLRLARVHADRAMLNVAERAKSLDEAKALCAKVVDDPATPPPLRAAASFALASIHESLVVADDANRDAHLAEARKLYDQITQEPKFSGSPYIALAKDRLSSLDQLKTRIAFVPGDSPTPPTPDTPPPTPQSGVKLDSSGGTMRPMSREEVEQMLRRNPSAQPEPLPTPGAPTPAPQPSTPEPAPAPPQPAPQPATQPAGG